MELIVGAGLAACVAGCVAWLVLDRRAQQNRQRPVDIDKDDFVDRVADRWTPSLPD